MRRSNIQDLTSVLLKVVPEIREEYETEVRFSQEAEALFTEQDYRELEEIANLHGLPPERYGEPGMTIVFEDILLPFILGLLEDRTKSTRIAEIMDWLESLASSDVFDLGNLVALSICEPLITTHESKVSQMYPYLGEKTREMCRELFDRFRVSVETMRLFGLD